MAKRRHIMTRLEDLSTERKILLAARHKGLIQEVADELGVDQSYVSVIYHGRRPVRTAAAQRIRRALEKRLRKLLAQEAAA